MVKIDLITGFLGSGKTTFIRKYASYLMSQGQNIGILENDYGAINVDMMLLSDLRGDNCELEMVSGGCDRDCHRRRFKTKLISMGMCGYDRVLIEPSGIFDMDEFFDTLHEDPLDRWYEIGNVIAIVDAKLDSNLSEQANYVLASEAANAGLIVLSRSQEASQDEITETINHLNRALSQVKCRRTIDESHVLSTDWSMFGEEDFARISSCGYDPAGYVKQDVDNDGDFDSLFHEPPSDRGTAARSGKRDHEQSVMRQRIPHQRVPEAGGWQLDRTERHPPDHRNPSDQRRTGSADRDWRRTGEGRD